MPAGAARIGRTSQECDAGDLGRGIPGLLLRMSGMGHCLNVAVRLFAVAVVRLLAAPGDRLFLVDGCTLLRGRAVMLRWC